MLEKIIKIILTIFAVGALILVGYAIYILSMFGVFDKSYTATELVQNIKDKQAEIYELKRYFNEIVPDNRFVEIEFDDEDELSRFGITPLDSIAGNPYGPIFLEWGLKTNTPRMDSIIAPMGWTQETLKTLYEKLEDANCIGIESGEPVTIKFQRSGMGMYSFNVFEKPMTDSTKNWCNNICSYIIVNDTLVLEYGGGAVGSDCFPK